MKKSRTGKNIRLLRIITRAFRIKPKYISLFLFNTLLRWLNSFFFFVDRLCFPALKKNKLDKPVFLIGHLRSGTTFLHRFLSIHNSGLRTFLLLEMIIPPLSLKKIIRPFLSLVYRISLDRIYDPKIHKTGLNKEETDDIALYFRYLDGMLSWIYFHAWQKFESTATLRSSVMEVCNQPRFVNYLSRVYKMLAYQSGKRIMSKSFSSLFYLEELLRNNPDGKFIILIRDPGEAIPSLMSLEESVQNKMHGKRNVEKMRDVYFSNLYELSRYYYEVLESAYRKYRNHPQFVFLSYQDLKTNFGATLRLINKMCELDDTNPEYQRAIENQAAKQTEYESSHYYSPKRFNLDEATIKNDIPFYLQFMEERNSEKKY